MDEQNLNKIIDQRIQNYMTQKQFNLSKIPNHEHNGTDTPNIPISSIKESIIINGKTNGVFNSDILDTQKVNLEYTSNIPNPKTISMLPINVIYGYGVGVHSAFNGGDAEVGTMIFFDNATNSRLWIKTINGWYGIPYDMTA